MTPSLPCHQPVFSVALLLPPFAMPFRPRAADGTFWSKVGTSMACRCEKARMTRTLWIQRDLLLHNRSGFPTALGPRQLCTAWGDRRCQWAWRMSWIAGPSQRESADSSAADCRGCNTMRNHCCSARAATRTACMMHSMKFVLASQPAGPVTSVLERHKSIASVASVLVELACGTSPATDNLPRNDQRFRSRWQANESRLTGGKNWRAYKPEPISRVRMSALHLRRTAAWRGVAPLCLSENSFGCAVGMFDTPRWRAQKQALPATPRVFRCRSCLPVYDAGLRRRRLQSSCLARFCGPSKPTVLLQLWPEMATTNTPWDCGQPHE